MSADFSYRDVYTDFSGINQLKHDAKKNSPDALKAATKQFEALMMQMMMKSMRDATMEGGLFGSDQEQMFTELYDKQLSLHLSGSQGMGLADMLYAQLNPSAGLSSEAGIDPIMQADILRQTSDLSPLLGNKKAAFSNPSDFIQSLFPYAQQAAQSTGLNPKFLLAQAALETGWGQHIIHSQDGANSHNLFGIKAGSGWQGDQVSVPTWEFLQGAVHEQTAAFRSYGSYQQSFDDYMNFIGSQSRYQDAMKVSGDAMAYGPALHAAGSATDPAYAKKITEIMNGQTMRSALGALQVSTL